MEKEKKINKVRRDCHLSVIVAVRDEAEALVSCVDSILAGGNDDMELIIVSYGSNSETAEIIAEYREMDSRVVLVKHRTDSKVAALNRAFDYAGGEWLTFVDVCDRLRHGYLVRIFETIKKQNIEKISLISSSYTVIMPDGTHSQMAIYKTYGGVGNVTDTLSVKDFFADYPAKMTEAFVGKFFRSDVIREADLHLVEDSVEAACLLFVAEYLRELKRAGEREETDAHGDIIDVVRNYGYYYSYRGHQGCFTLTEALSKNESAETILRTWKRYYELTDEVKDDKARVAIERAFCEGLIDALKAPQSPLSLARRREVYELIYLLVRPKIYRKLLPWYFEFMASFRLWKLYDLFSH